MSYVLLCRNQSGRPDILQRYHTRKGALIGLRAANDRAGWTRISRCYSSHCDMEWARDHNDQYDYAPYIIMHEFYYTQRYLPREMEVA